MSSLRQAKHILGPNGHQIPPQVLILLPCMAAPDGMEQAPLHSVNDMVGKCFRMTEKMWERTASWKG